MVDFRRPGHIYEHFIITSLLRVVVRVNVELNSYMHVKKK